MWDKARGKEAKIHCINYVLYVENVELQHAVFVYFVSHDSR